jgi:hypothetical protein
MAGAPTTAGVAGTQGKPVHSAFVSEVDLTQAPPTFLRLLAEREATIGGASDERP